MVKYDTLDVVHKVFKVFNFIRNQQRMNLELESSHHQRCPFQVFLSLPQLEVSQLLENALCLNHHSQTITTPSYRKLNRTESRAIRVRNQVQSTVKIY